MGKFKGKNDNATVIGKTHFRARYHSEAFADTALNEAGGEHISVVNFNFSELVYYGKIDDESDPVVINSRQLVSIGTAGISSEAVKLTLPPIKDMFERFQRKFVQAVRAQKISEDDPYLASPQVHSNFVDPIREYKIYVSEIMDAFNGVFLADPERQKNLFSVNDYVEQLMEFLRTMGSDYPITLTGWRKSRKSSLMSTGLALSISDLDCGVDEQKEEFIFDKNCVQFYFQACKQYGFSVSKQCPWVIVADLASAGSAQYMGQNGVFSPRHFFQKFYTKTYTLDIDLLTPIIRKSYNDFVKNNKFYKDIKVCNKDHDKLIYKNKFRNNINKLEYNNQYDLYYFIPYYIKIRNIEDEFPYDEPSIVRITQKASEFEKLLDKERAMGYINEQFRKKYRYAHGSYLYYKKRLEERQRQEG